MRVLGQRHVDRDVVRLGKKFIERDALDLHGLGAARGEIGIVGEHPHAEGLGALGDFAADAAEADDAQGLFEQFDAGKALPVPLAGLHGGRGLGHRTGAAQDVGKRQLGRGDGVARGRVHHDHATLGGRIDIDIIDAHARPTDNLEQRRRGKNRRGDLGLRTHGDRVDVFDEFQNLLRRGAVGLGDFQARLRAQVGYSLG